MKLSRKHTLIHKILIVDGIGRTGKLDTANLISTFKGVEKSRLDYTFDVIPKLWNLKKITDDAAIIFLKLEADLHLYENMLGRKVNFRLNDKTSIYNYPNIPLYINRMLKNEGESVIDDINKEKPIFQCSTHNTLSDVSLFLKAFKNKFYMIHLIRHPIDIIYSLHNRGFGSRIGTDPREIELTQEHEENIIPTYMETSEDSYLKINEYERMVLMVDYYMERNLNGYLELTNKQRKQIRIVNINTFNHNPLTKCKKLAEFLGTEITDYTPIHLKLPHFKERNDIKERKGKLKSINSNISEPYIYILNNTIKNYNILLRHGIN